MISQMDGLWETLSSAIGLPYKLEAMRVMNAIALLVS